VPSVQDTTPACGPSSVLEVKLKGGTRMNKPGRRKIKLTAIVRGGFDIESGVQAATSNSPVSQGSAFAVLMVGGSTRFYSIDLVTGAATDLGVIGTGMNLAGLAVGRTRLE
jgi:hypothetical protein